LAKTLLHRPRLLLLDEPASGMDPIARRDLRMVLERLAAEGATIIISSHILSELSDMCSSVGIMHQGRLLRHGTLRSVLRNLEAEQSHIQLDVVGDATAAVTMLRGWDEVDDLSVDDQRISFILRGDEAVRARLLKALIDRGAVISAFVPRETGIESVLMDVIRSVDG
ncbi:MAG: hypothetical protein PVF63_07705, partial [Gammaproteobacteria bacterium]